MNRMRVAACAAVGALMVCGLVIWLGAVDQRGTSGSAVNAAVASSAASPAVVSAPLPALRSSRVLAGPPAGAAPGPAAPTAAPGAGELFSYSTTETPHREGPYTYYPVNIDVDEVLASALSGRLTFTAPDGTQIPLDYDRHVSHEDGNWTWLGRESGANAARDAVITFGPDATYGSLPPANGQKLAITTVRGKTYVTSAPFSQLQPGIRPGGDTVVKAAATPSTDAVAAQPVVAAAGAVVGTPVDVVIGYSAGYRIYLGSSSAVTTRLTNLVDVANRALGNSAVSTASFRLVGTLEVNYGDGSDNGIALSDLASTSATSPLAAMRTARAQYGADLVAFMRRFSPGQNGCGLAYIPQAPYASNGRDQTFAVVGDGTIDTGGGTYSYCPDTSLAHEMGHNLGAQHNSQQNASGGLYPYSYGYRNDGANFYDIMAYGQNGQEAELLYSSPGVSICKGFPCGVANVADVARTFRETMLTASTFRAAPAPEANPNAAPGTLKLANGLNRCLEVSAGGTADGSVVQMWACNGLRWQNWLMKPETSSLVSSGTSSVLDAEGYGTANGTLMHLWTGYGTPNQAWRFAHASVVSAKYGRVLDAVGVGATNGTRIQVYDGVGAANQSFTFDPITGQFQIDTGRCLDVTALGISDGTPVQLWDCTGAPNQRFRLSSNGSIVGYGGLCLEVAKSGAVNGADVHMQKCDGTPGQIWRLRGEVRGVSSNRCLDDPSGGRLNGSRPHLWDCYGGENQIWEYQPN